MVDSRSTSNRFGSKVGSAITILSSRSASPAALSTSTAALSTSTTASANIRLKSEGLIARWFTGRDAVRRQGGMASGDRFLAWRFRSGTGRKANSQKLDKGHAQVANL